MLPTKLRSVNEAAPILFYFSSLSNPSESKVKHKSVAKWLAPRVAEISLWEWRMMHTNLLIYLHHLAKRNTDVSGCWGRRMTVISVIMVKWNCKLILSCWVQSHLAKVWLENWTLPTWTWNLNIYNN